MLAESDTAGVPLIVPDKESVDTIDIVEDADAENVEIPDIDDEAVIVWVGDRLASILDDGEAEVLVDPLTLPLGDILKDEEVL